MTPCINIGITDSHLSQKDHHRYWHINNDKISRKDLVNKQEFKLKINNNKVENCASTFCLWRRQKQIFTQLKHENSQSVILLNRLDNLEII